MQLFMVLYIQSLKKGILVKMKDKLENYHKLKKLTDEWGIDLFGTGNLSEVNIEVLDLPPNINKELRYGISLGMRLANCVIKGIVDRPTRLYFHHYRQVNNLLDQTAVKLANFIQRSGWEALPIPASQVIDWKRQYGHLSHKVVAYQAGLGWIGRNNLLVNPKFGARVRYISILTDMPLPSAIPLVRNCGDCFNCISVCPVSAIKEKHEDFERERCLEKLRLFSKECNIGHYICGICVKACKGSESYTR